MRFKFIPQFLENKIKPTYHRLRDLKKDRIAMSHLRNLKNKAIEKDNINVAFIVQLPEIWDKQEPVFNAMRYNSSFRVTLIAVPPYDFENNILEKQDIEENYFYKRYKKIVNTVSGTECIDLTEYDYVFMPRPYDDYLPPNLRSYNVVNYAKTCYIPYGYSGTDVLNSSNTNKKFFRNIYCAFLDRQILKDRLEQEFNYSIKKKLQYFLCLGYPALENYISCNSSDNVKLLYKKVLWTPRWSNDERIGGSHFSKYKDAFLLSIDKFEKCKFRFRPHPLLFDNFIKTGAMSHSDVNEYIRTLENKGVQYSSNCTIDYDFENTDILITDFSSIIIMFFFSGRPIIYCNSEIELNEEFSEIMSACYIANDWSEVEQYLTQLFEGKDVLAKKRKEIIRKFADKHNGATNRIVEFIKKDFKNCDL